LSDAVTQRNRIVGDGDCVGANGITTAVIPGQSLPRTRSGAGIQASYWGLRDSWDKDWMPVFTGMTDFHCQALRGQ